MALPGTNAETPIDSHRLDGSLWKPHSILSYPEGHFNPPSDLTLTSKALLHTKNRTRYRVRFFAPGEGISAPEGGDHSGFLPSQR